MAFKTLQSYLTTSLTMCILYLIKFLVKIKYTFSSNNNKYQKTKKPIKPNIIMCYLVTSSTIIIYIMLWFTTKYLPRSNKYLVACARFINTKKTTSFLSWVICAKIIAQNTTLLPIQINNCKVSEKEVKSATSKLRFARR